MDTTERQDTEIRATGVAPGGSDSPRGVLTSEPAPRRAGRASGPLAVFDRASFPPDMDWEGQRPTSLAHAEELLRTGRDPQLTWYEWHLLRAMISAEQSHVVESVAALVELPMLYKASGVSQWTHRAALLDALKASRDPIAVWPRLRAGERVELVNDQILVPLWSRGESMSMWDAPMPAELVGTGWDVPWNWPLVCYLRQYLPYAFRRSLEWFRESRFDGDYVQLDKPLGNGDLTLADVLTQSYEGDAPIHSRDPAAIVFAMPSVLAMRPAGAFLAFERLQGFLPGSERVVPRRRSGASTQYDTQYGYYTSGKDHAHRYPTGRPLRVSRRDYSKRIAEWYQENGDDVSDRAVRAWNPTPTRSLLEGIRAEIRGDTMLTTAPSAQYDTRASMLESCDRIEAQLAILLGRVTEIADRLAANDPDDASLRRAVLSLVK